MARCLHGDPCPPMWDSAKNAPAIPPMEDYKGSREHTRSRMGSAVISSCRTLHVRHGCADVGAIGMTLRSVRVTLSLFIAQVGVCLGVGSTNRRPWGVALGPPQVGPADMSLEDGHPGLGIGRRSSFPARFFLKDADVGGPRRFAGRRLRISTIAVLAKTPHLRALRARARPDVRASGWGPRSTPLVRRPVGLHPPDAPTPLRRPPRKPTLHSRSGQSAAQLLGLRADFRGRSRSSPPKLGRPPGRL